MLGVAGLTVGDDYDRPHPWRQDGEWSKDFAFLANPLPSPSADNGLIGTLNSGATRTIVISEAIQRFRGSLEEVNVDVSTATHRGTLKVTHKGVIGCGLQTYYATELDSQFYLYGSCVVAYCLWLQKSDASRRMQKPHRTSTRS